MACALLGCQTTQSAAQNQSKGLWEYKGKEYASFNEYYDAKEADTILVEYPAANRLADFMTYDDKKLGLYYFYRIRNRNSFVPELSRETIDDLKSALNERGLKGFWFQCVEERKMGIGMPKIGLYALMGKPYKENRTVTQYGESIQFVYGDQYHRMYFYTNNGVVRSWQN